MATYTKGFVLTDNKDPFLIAELTKKAIKDVQYQFWDQFPKIDAYKAPRRTFMDIDFQAVKSNQTFTHQSILSNMPEIHINPESKGLDFVFGIHSFCKDAKDQVEFEKRSLTAYFSCDSDRAEYGEKSISFLMGDYGKSCEIMKAVITKIAEHLECDGYFMASDCSGDSEFERIVESPNTVDSSAPTV